MNRPLSVDALLSVAARKGPCLTLVVPNHHPGAPEGSQARQLRALLKEVKQQVNGALPARMESAVAELAASLPDAGGDGFAAYATPEGLVSYPLRTGEAKAVWGSYPYVLPLLAPAYTTDDVFVLSLNMKQVKLFQCTGGACRAVTLPSDVPASLEEAGKFQTAAAHGDNWKSAGGANVRFGTSGDREARRESVEHFCAALDQGLRETLNGRPLVVLGVKEETAAYRRASRHSLVVESEAKGNAENLTLAEVADIAQHAAAGVYRSAGESVAAAFREARDRARTLRGAREVFPAAAQGRVHQLCIREGTEAIAPLGTEWNLAQLPAEDLVNASAVATLRHAGQVFLLPQESLAVEESVCAILRY